MLEIIGIVTTIIAVSGVLLNNHHDKRCFILWIFSNALSLIIHAALMCWSLTIRDAIFLYLAFDGYQKWTKYQQFFKERKRWQMLIK